MADYVFGDKPDSGRMRIQTELRYNPRRPTPSNQQHGV
jgi:hypothetical protein